MHAPASWRPREIWTLVGVLGVMLCAFGLHLGSVVISDMDEGTYLYAGQLISEGLVPYRDFLLAHPPMIAWFAAAWSRLFGMSIVPVRIAYLVVVLASSVPLYIVVRSISGSGRGGMAPGTEPGPVRFAPGAEPGPARFAPGASVAGLLAIVSYAAGMLLLANMGRTVRLEPLMNAFVIAAVACRLEKPSSRAFAVVMGACLTCALFVKAIAVIPAGLLVIGDLLWDRRPFRPLLMRWLFAALGAGVVLLPLLGWCLSQPRFVQDVLLSQVNRPRIDVALRLHYFVQNIARFPPLLIGLVASAVMVVRAADTRLRTVALLALGSTVILLFAFKTFFAYYIVQALPWLACTFAVVTDQGANRWLGSRWNRLSWAAVGLFALVAPVVYAEMYQRTATGHVSEPQKVLALLDAQQPRDGYIYSMYPAFGLWSGRRLYPWYYQADSLVPRINHWIGDQDFLGVFQGASALVLYPGELDDYPRARAYVEANFTEALHGEFWTTWLRASPAPTAAQAVPAAPPAPAPLPPQR